MRQANIVKFYFTTSLFPSAASVDHIPLHHHQVASFCFDFIIFRQFHSTNTLYNQNLL